MDDRDVPRHFSAASELSIGQQGVGDLSTRMKIDIGQLTEQELIALNRQIVERLRFLQQMRAHARMLDFSVGDRVSFQPDGRPTLFGVLIRYNRNTVTVITESGEQWNVAPGLLSKVEDITPKAGESSDEGNVVKLPRK